MREKGLKQEMQLKNGIYLLYFLKTVKIFGGAHAYSSAILFLPLTS